MPQVSVIKVPEDGSAVQPSGIEETRRTDSLGKGCPDPCHAREGVARFFKSNLERMQSCVDALPPESIC